jgi:hypothetical protein
MGKRRCSVVGQRYSNSGRVQDAQTDRVRPGTLLQNTVLLSMNAMCGTDPSLNLTPFQGGSLGRLVPGVKALG